jgi:hypothetical protein
MFQLLPESVKVTFAASVASLVQDAVDAHVAEIDAHILCTLIDVADVSINLRLRHSSELPESLQAMSAETGFQQERMRMPQVSSRHFRVLQPYRLLQQPFEQLF